MLCWYLKNHDKLFYPACQSTTYISLKCKKGCCNILYKLWQHMIYVTRDRTELNPLNFITKSKYHAKTWLIIRETLKTDVSICLNILV